VRLGPKGCCNGEGVNPLVPPPDAFVAATVRVAMVQSANGNGELVADLAPHRPLLCELDVVGIRGRSTADETRLSGHKSQMVAVAFAHRFA
jgi:hypothetical protein